MYMFIAHVCVYVNVSVSVYVYVNAYVHFYGYVYVNMHVHIHICVCICICVYVYVHMHVYVYLHISVCVYVYVYVYAYNGKCYRRCQALMAKPKRVPDVQQHPIQKISPRRSVELPCNQSQDHMYLDSCKTCALRRGVLGT